MSKQIIRKPIAWFSLLLIFVCIFASDLWINHFAAVAAEIPDSKVERIFGDTRYETSFESANAVMRHLGVNKLDSIIVASGLDFADALAGSYLAAAKNAPIILSSGRNTSQLQAYIRSTVTPGGTVYILGGEKAMPSAVTQGLDDYSVKRLSGATRYETNLEILLEAEVSGCEILVCTGDNFADSLSASAVGKPILLVNNKRGVLTQAQRDYLSDFSASKIYILGGKTAISEKLEAELRKYGAVERLGGATRYDTSILVAEKFFDDPKAAVLSYALTYPDGLCGGLLAYNLQGPMILTRDHNREIAKQYVQGERIQKGIVLGGEGLISNDTVRYIFGSPIQEPEMPKRYKIIYELFGGQNHVANPAEYTQGEHIIFQSPTRDHYRFDGWYLDSMFVTKVDSVTSNDSGDVTLYAKWTPDIYEINYVLDGGTNHENNPSAFAYGTEVTLNAPSREGHTFAGWYLDSAFDIPADKISGSDNVTLYAKWVKNTFTITYVLDGGENSKENPAEYTFGVETELHEPVKENCTFEGWYLESTYDTKIDKIVASDSGDLTLYAKWKPDAYSITYILDGGKNGPRNPEEYVYGESFSLQGATKAYNSFKGWYLDATFETKIVEIKETDSGDLTLYAKWEPFSYSITYELNKGENSANNPDVYYYGNTVKLEAPTRENHTFDGWYSDSGFKNRVTEISASHSGNITLYAKWYLTQLNVNGEGMDNMIWSWWYYPQVISTESTVYWGYADNDGYCGVAAYDIATCKTTTTALKRLSAVDDHNGLGLTILEDGRIMCVYAGGHDSNYEMHVRISEKPYDITHFSTNLVLKSVGKTCYGQIIQHDGKIFIFYRINGKSWGYRTSVDGVNWSDEVIMVSADMQYYCKIMPTTQDGFVRICMYSNPTSDDPRIRMGFMDLDTGMLYNADGATELGKKKVSYQNFDVIIDKPADKVQRMFDVAITDPEITRILFTTFSSVKSSNDSIYYLYDSGKVVEICKGGVPLWDPKYQGGASFAGNDTIVLARNSDGFDYVEIYDYKNGVITRTKSVRAEKVGGGGIRNARPIVDVNGRAFLWHNGYYNPNSYRDFSTDAMIVFSNNFKYCISPVRNIRTGPSRLQVKCWIHKIYVLLV